MYSGRSRARTAYSLAASHREPETAAAHKAQIKDNRASTSQLEITQAVMQLAGGSNFKQQRVENKPEKGESQHTVSNAKITESGANWEILEVGDYLMRHRLKLQSQARVGGQSALYLTDGSVIVIDSNQYWRHESGDQKDAYFDSSHSTNFDDSRTYFWTRNGYAIYSGRN